MKGWNGKTAWLTCGCGWYTVDHVSMRSAKRAFGIHKHALDPS